EMCIRDRLETLRDGYPLSGFLTQFRELTRLEWFLTGEERRQLERIDRFVERYDAERVVRSLTPAFVDALERTLRGGSAERTRGTRSADAVDVMTVHQAKGLEFDTVLVPYLSDEEWCVEHDYARRARTRLLAAALEDDVDSPLRADVAAETVGEEWRVLHVALTRAANHLFVFGSEYDYDGGEGELAVSTADACLDPAIEWSVAGERMELWSTLTESFESVRGTYPRTVADRTDELAVAADERPGTITYYAGYGDRSIEPLETREAIETVHRLGRLLRDGTLLPAADAASHASEAGPPIRVPGERRASALTADATRFPSAPLVDDGGVPVAMRHSYTAMESYEACSRQHYLEHVVRAIDDPIDADSSDSERPGSPSSPRIVGSVFHDVAEEAFHRGYDGRDDWREAAVRQLTARNLLEHREAVLACVDRYFEATAAGIDDQVADWTPLAAELPFALADVAGVEGDVVGYVDTVRRLPEAAGGGFAVLDYKATATRIDPADADQLALYARACRRRLEEPIAAVGYVYVGAVDGPGVDLFEPDEVPPWESVRETLEGVDDPSYRETTPGEHCRRCPHRSLGCAPAAYIPDAAADDD
ncbi:RecB family exonuclease, partial [Natronococcus jeotgali]